MNVHGIMRLIMPVLAVIACGGLRAAPADVNIVPRPASIETLTGSFALSDATRIVATDAESRRIAGLLQDYLLEQHGLRLAIAAAPPRAANYILLSRAGAGELPAEGYRLEIGTDRILLTGTAAGLFYGTQSLAQLLPVAIQPSIGLPAMKIEDQPRFGYRGVLLDVGRHYFSVSFIKKLLDLAAQYKINRFHWHLTDNEGWRIEIRKYPKLTTPAAPYYTQEQVKDIVDYARARFITVVPEIEMPGHSGAALAAYPELGCEPRDRAVAFCPKEETFIFLENVLSEVIALFPGPYVHIGSDEVEKEGWRQSPEAQAILKREGLKDEDELQSFFARRIEKIVTSRGKRMIGWDEILQGGLPPRTIVMSWRGEEGGVEAVRQGHEAIMAPSEYTYFDYNQGDARREPVNIGGFIPLEKAYAYDPMPKQLAQHQHEFILGAQAQLWTEYVATPEHAEYMLYPRLLAFAEAVWSPAAVRSFDDFQRRLPYQLGRLDKQDVRYRIPEPEGLRNLYTTTQDRAVIALTSPVAGGRMFYTLDGSEPNVNSLPYGAPLQVSLPPDRPVTLNLIVVTPQERRSVVYGATFLRREYHEALRADVRPGLAYALYDGKFGSVNDIVRGASVRTGTLDSIDLARFERASNYAVRFEGFIAAPADDYYQFAMTSDDGAVLEIDGEVVIDNDGDHAPRRVAGHIPLRRGLHKVRLRYFQGMGGSTLDLQWGGASQPLRRVESSAWFH
jgi:hexosaminidase